MMIVQVWHEGPRIFMSALDLGFMRVGNGERCLVGLCQIIVASVNNVTFIRNERVEVVKHII